MTVPTVFLHRQRTVNDAVWQLALRYAAAFRLPYHLPRPSRDPGAIAQGRSQKTLDPLMFPLYNVHMGDSALSFALVLPGPASSLVQFTVTAVGLNLRPVGMGTSPLAGLTRDG